MQRVHESTFGLSFIGRSVLFRSVLLLEVSLHRILLSAILSRLVLNVQQRHKFVFNYMQTNLVTQPNKNITMHVRAINKSRRTLVISQAN